MKTKNDLVYLDLFSYKKQPKMFTVFYNTIKVFIMGSTIS